MGAEKGLLVPLERKCCKNDAAWCLESSTYMRSIVLTWRKTNLVCNLSLHLKKAHREFPGILKQKKKSATLMWHIPSLPDAIFCSFLCLTHLSDLILVITLLDESTVLEQKMGSSVLGLKNTTLNSIRSKPNY